MTRLTIALTILMASTAMAQTGSQKLPPGHHYFTCEGTYRYKTIADLIPGSREGSGPLPAGPVALSLEVREHSASLASSLPGSPYTVTKITPVGIEFEGTQAETVPGFWDKGQWQGTFDRVHGTFSLMGPGTRRRIIPATR
jgi:hypothetical protein